MNPFEEFVAIYIGIELQLLSSDNDNFYGNSNGRAALLYVSGIANEFSLSPEGMCV